MERLEELNQQSLVIIMQVLDVLEKIQKNIQLINKTTDTQKEVVHILQKLGKNSHSLEELMPMLIQWTGTLSQLNKVLLNYSETLKTRSQHVKYQLTLNKMALQQ